MLPAPRRLTAALLVLPLVCGAALLASQSAQARSSITSVEARWDTSTITAGGDVTVVVITHGQPGGSQDVGVVLDGITIKDVPDGCEASSTVAGRSYLDSGGSRLVCRLAQVVADQLLVVRGTVTRAAGGAVSGAVSVDGVGAQLPSRTVAPGKPASPRALRLLSSPDFLNADTGDLRKGPNFWTPKKSTNAINGRYRTAIDNVMTDWQSLAPDAVLVAGDLVEGRWDVDSKRTGTFGPLRTNDQRKAAIRRAARTFYPQWIQRFRDRGLSVYPAIGDHEIGDNPWPGSKRRLVKTFKKQFAHYFTKSGGRARFADRPRTSRAQYTSYAFRPVPSVQVISIDVFDITEKKARIDVDSRQLTWLKQVLARAQADGVRWTIVQGHTPILEPTRARGSSELNVPRGADSRLWKAFEAGGVDLYLNGEVHDATLSEAGGVTQLSHGGAFQYGLINYALLDIYDDRIEIELRDYSTKARHKKRLWETRSPGMPSFITVDPKPFTIGTATVGAPGGLQSRSGILDPYSTGR